MRTDRRECAVVLYYANSPDVVDRDWVPPGRATTRLREMIAGVRRPGWHRGVAIRAIIYEPNGSLLPRVETEVSL